MTTSSSMRRRRVQPFQGVSPRLLLRRLWREANGDEVLDRAAQASFYFLFSLMPMLFFLVTLLAYLPLREPVEELLDRFAPVVPAQALDLVRGQLASLLGQERPRLLTLGLVVTLWSASRGVDAMRNCLNAAYDVVESRPYWRSQLTSIVLTVVGIVLVPVSFAMVVLGGDLGAWLAAKVGVREAFHAAWSLLRWPITALVLMTLSALLYWLLPDVRQPFRFVTPGAVSGTSLWLVSTWAFTRYVERFGSFDVTYGSIAGVIVLLTWFYLTSLVYILGGEVNAVVEQLAAERYAHATGTAIVPVRQKGRRPPPPDAEARQRERMPRAFRPRVGTDGARQPPPERMPPLDRTSSPEETPGSPRVGGHGNEPPPAP